MIEGGGVRIILLPAARTVYKIELVISVAKCVGVLVGAGFNHRYHSGLRQARILFEDGKFSLHDIAQRFR